ncbi:(2Fe-2S)-binding protein [Planctobacterium marinum]
MIAFELNGEKVTWEGDPNMPLLWYVRDELNLTGSKFGCGVAMCGACTMHLNGAPIRSCSTPIAAANGGSITTIEGLTSEASKAIQTAWQKLDVVQCGYCQSGQVMSATALLEKNKSPSNEDIDMAMQGNVCRCATYQRIRAAIHEAADSLAKEVS